jgi:hypothetical protein
MNCNIDKEGEYWWITIPNCSHFDELTYESDKKSPCENLKNEIYFSSKEEAMDFCRDLAKFLASRLDKLTDPPDWLSRFKTKFYIP